MAERKLLTALKGLGFVEEGTFGTDPTGQAAMRAFDISFEPGPTFHDVAYQKSEALRGPDARIAGGKGGKLKFSVYLRAHPGSQASCLSLMEHMGATLAAGATVANLVVVGGASTVNGVTANYSSYYLGQGFMHVPNTGNPSLRFINKKIVAADATLTVNAPWTQLPVATDDNYAVDTIMPTIGDPAKYFSFNVWEGNGTAGSNCIKWIISGCTGKWSIPAVAANGLPVINFEFDCDNYSYSEAGTTVAADALTAARPILGDKVYIDGVAVDVKSIAFDPGLVYSPVAATSGANGRSAFTFTDSNPVLEITPLHDTGFLSKWEGVTKCDVQFEGTYSATSAWGIWMPGAYVDECPPEDDGGIMRRKVKFVGRDPGKSTDTTPTVVTLNLPKWALAITH